MAAPRERIVLAVLLAPATLILGVFFLLPLLIVALFSVLMPGLYGGVEWAFYHWNYGRIFGWADGLMEIFEPIYLQILLRSLGFATLTVLLCLILCYPVAFWMSRLPERWRLLFLFLVTLPFFSSLIVRLYAWLLILRPSGLLNQGLLALGVVDAPLDILYTPAAVVLGMVYIMVPFMFLPLFAAVDNLDRSLVEASFDLGATRAQTFRKVILPQTLPGIVAGSVIVFIPSVGNFIVPDILGGAKGLMMGNLIEQQFLSARNWPFGSALAMVVMSVVLMVLLTMVARSRRVRG
ncbi:ABC transporter permease [Rubellimicrobium roseum]|uniref:ABC transporter permease n=1 Tax=Rubellimicrobium roseum TaxID=687525 RepID=A0A5C4N710_9RHOB|nr:ABC transporter permease [Rubellimicrobium roseum]TNC67524.1 ABC transporter permease [Rubellimicrobium roseum]